MQKNKEGYRKKSAILSAKLLKENQKWTLIKYCE